VAYAMRETVIDFRNGQVPGEWSIADIDTPQPTNDGILLHAPVKQGVFIGTMDIPHDVQALQWSIIAAKPTKVSIAWHPKGSGDSAAVLLPFMVPKAGLNVIDLSMDAYAQWENGHIDRLGIVLPAGTQVAVQEIRFREWGYGEKIISILRSFWIFDSYLPNSINFLWGPVIAFNPIGAQHMFRSMPPSGRSGMWLIYIIGICAAMSVVVARKWQKRSLTWTAFGLIALSLWLIMDIRMGTELLSYAYRDMQNFVLAPQTTQSLRSYESLNAAIENVRSDISGEGTYVAIGPEPSPFFTILRYFLYPALPVKPEHAKPGQFWFIYERSDVQMGDDMRLHHHGEAISSAGILVKRIGQFTFLFRTHP
jgi:hypothetical protein